MCRIKGNAVFVEFLLIFTRYLDSEMFTSYDVRRAFERHLAVRRIGKFTATRNGFLIEEIHPENEGLETFETPKKWVS